MKKIAAWLAGMLLGMVLGAGAAEMPPPPPEKLDNPPPRAEKKNVKNNRDERLFWRAFSEMSEADRRSMHELRLKDEAAYKAAMDRRIAAIRTRDQAEKQEMQSLIAAWKSAPLAEKAKYRDEVRKRIAAHYNERLAENRRRLEEMRRRAEKMSLELTRREVDAAKNIDAITDVVLEKGFPPPPPPERKRVKRAP